MTTVKPRPVTPRPVTPLGILAEKLDNVSRMLEGVDGVDSALLAELRDARDLAGGLDPYLTGCTTQESAGLRLIAERTAAEDWNRDPDGPAIYLEQEMLSGHVEGQTLKFLVHATRAKRVLEIGMFTGYSALAMAEGLPEDGEVVACEFDPYVSTFAQRCFDESSDGHKITVKVGPALGTLTELAEQGEVFDFVFIDADKAGYIDYLNTLLESTLLGPQAVICVDNTLMQGLPYLHGKSTVNGDAIAAFNKAVADDPRVEQVLLPLRDGLTLIRRAS